MTQVEPQFLYRYRHLRGEHCKWTSRILTDSVLHFAAPTSFNDPYDCKIHFVMTASNADLHHWYMAQVEERRPDLNSVQRGEKVEDDLSRFDRTAFVQRITRGLQEEVNRVGILSLSAQNDNVILWSHYADGHTGLCLQFPGQGNAEFFGESQRVEYSPTYPHIDPIHDSHERKMQAFLLTKACDWHYEAEWRIIHPDGPGEKRFPERLLCGVILGALMSTEDRRYVARLVKTRQYRVNLYEAKVREGSFGLEIRPYEP